MISFSSGAGQVCGESRGCTTGGAIENKWEKPCVFVASIYINAVYTYMFIYDTYSIHSTKFAPKDVQQPL